MNQENTSNNGDSQFRVFWFSEEIRARKLYREFFPKNSFFFRNQGTIFTIFAIFVPLGLASLYGIKWLWVGVVYVIFHGIAEGIIRQRLDVKFARENPLESYLHFRK